MTHRLQLSKPTCSAISEAFLALQRQAGFQTLPPSSLLHDSVPMSFVMSAGLIQVENELDTVIAQTGGRFAFTQPCFRHFDVKQVGQDSTHLSLFHMAAAFHIGSSQRGTLLPCLWHFLTQTLQLAPKRLWVTYLDDPELGCDAATLASWQSIGVPSEHLIGLDQQHCFWRQRSTGQIASDGKKCGPHTEVFVERSAITCTACETQPQANIGNCRCGRFVEVSNSLFIENYLDDQGRLIPADTVFSECVIGIERLAMLLQGVPDVYHTERFDAWRSALAPLLPAQLDADQAAAVNIILDHLSAFERLTADGAPAPGHGGRKYLMRKLARGAMEKMLVLGLPVEDSLAALVSHPSLQILCAEWQRFERTLQRRSRQKPNSLTRPSA